MRATILLALLSASWAGSLVWPSLREGGVSADDPIAERIRAIAELAGELKSIERAEDFAAFADDFAQMITSDFDSLVEEVEKSEGKSGKAAAALNLLERKGHGGASWSNFRNYESEFEKIQKEYRSQVSESSNELESHLRFWSGADPAWAETINRALELIRPTADLEFDVKEVRPGEGVFRVTARYRDGGPLDLPPVEIRFESAVPGQLEHNARGVSIRDGTSSSVGTFALPADRQFAELSFGYCYAGYPSLSYYKSVTLSRGEDPDKAAMNRRLEALEKSMRDLSSHSHPDDSLPSGTIIAWHPPASIRAGGITKAELPDGWSLARDLDGRFLRGTTTLAQIGRDGGSHSHKHGGTTSRESKTFGVQAGGEKVADIHTHSFETDSASHMPPYTYVLFLMKD